MVELNKLQGELHMTSVFSYLITMIGGLFWASRVIVALLNSMQKDFPIQPLNPTV